MNDRSTTEQEPTNSTSLAKAGSSSGVSEGRSDVGRRITIRIVVSVAVGAAIAWLVWVRVPSTLSLRTDIQGYPTFNDFNPARLVYAYYGVAFIGPSCALIVYFLLGRVDRLMRKKLGHQGERARHASGNGGAGSLEKADQREVLPEPRGARHRPRTRPNGQLALRSLKVAFAAGVVGLEVSASIGGPGGPRLQAGLVGGCTYGAAAIAASAGIRRMRRHRLFNGGTLSWGVALAWANAGLSLSVVALLWAVSAGTSVDEQAIGRVVHYPWLPAWVVVGMVVGLGGIAVWKWFGTGLDAASAESGALTWIVAPVAVFMCSAVLPGALGGFQAFDDAQYLAAPQLVLWHGLVPWKDIYLLHGLLDDVAQGAVGLLAFSHTRWGGVAGIEVIVNPIVDVVMYFFAAWACGRRKLVLLAISMAIVSGFLGPVVMRFVLLPVVLMSLAWFLGDRSWTRGAVLAGLLVVFAIVTPEAALFVPCIGATVIGADLVWGYATSGSKKSLKGTLRLAASGIAFVGLWFVALYLTHSVRAFIDYYRTAARGHTLEGSHPISWNLLTTWPTSLMFIAPVVLWLGTLAWAVYRFQRGKSWTVRDWALVASALCAIVYFPKAIDRADAGHVAEVFFVTTPLIILWTSRLTEAVTTRIRTMSRERTRRTVSVTVIQRMAGVALFMAVLIGGVASGNGVVTVATSVDANFHPPVSSPPTSSLVRMGYVQPNAVNTRQIVVLGRLLNYYAGPKAPIFDFANEVGVSYFLLNRRPGASAYVIAAEQGKVSTNETVNQLAKTQPPVVLYYATTFGLVTYTRIPQSIRTPIIGRYILRHYHPVVDYGGQLLMLRDGVQPWGTHNGMERPAGGVTEGLYDATPTCSLGYIPNFIRPPKNAGGMASTSAAKVHRLGGTTSIFQGWAIDPQTGDAAQEVVVVAGGRVIGSGPTGISRPDVATSLHDAAAQTSGFSIAVTTATKLKEPVRAFAVLGTGSLAPLRPTSDVEGRVSVANAGAVVLPTGSRREIVNREGAGWVDNTSSSTSYQWRLSVPRRLTTYEWLVISFTHHMGRTDVSLGPDVSSSTSEEITFGLLGQQRGPAYVDAGSCLQWYGYRGHSLVLSSSKPLRGLIARVGR